MMKKIMVYILPQNIIKNNIELLKHYINNSTNILERRVVLVNISK